MRHRVSGTKFNVDKDHRVSLLRNLLTSYIVHQEITTTEAKAKALKTLFDRIVTRAKKNDLQARRIVGSYITMPEARIKLFDTLLPLMQNRTSGYSTTEKLIGERAGDSSKMMRIKMLVEEVEIKEEKKPAKKTAAKRVTKTKVEEK
jgi:large subunit ribosomal protein L17